MEFTPYDPSQIGELTAFYNREVACIPHCYPVTERDMAEALAPAAGKGPIHVRLREQSAFVAREGGRLVGFVHVAIGPPEEGKEDRGSIRFLLYERGHRAIGQALLAVAEAELMGKGMRRIEAWNCDDGYPFYHVNYAHLSDHLEHVQALLKFNGYAVSNGEVILDWPGFDPVPPVPPPSGVEARIRWTPGRGRLPGLKVDAFVNGEQMGNCYCISCGEFTDSEAAQEGLFVDGLFIDDAYQGQGIGRYLLQFAMREMHAIGYRNATISTELTNHRALLFYSNYGFKKVDWTFCYDKWPESPGRGTGEENQI